MSWQPGLYIGNTNEPNDFYLPDEDHSDETESKLNFVWAHHAADKKASFFFHISLNLDDLANDPGDDGGMTYQSTF